MRLTGGSSGAYYNDIGPKVHQVRGSALCRCPLTTDNGSVGNFASIAANPLVVALGQADVYALMNPKQSNHVISIPSGVLECLFAVDQADIA